MRHIIAYNKDGTIYGPAEPEMFPPIEDWCDIDNIIAEGGVIELWDGADLIATTDSHKEAAEFLDAELEVK